MKLAQQNIRSKRNNIKPMFDMVAEQAELGSRAFFCANDLILVPCEAVMPKLQILLSLRLSESD
jgi:hypothetical protein